MVFFIIPTITLAYFERSNMPNMSDAEWTNFVQQEIARDQTAIEFDKTQIPPLQLALDKAKAELAKVQADYEITQANWSGGLLCSPLPGQPCVTKSHVDEAQAVVNKAKEPIDYLKTDIAMKLDEIANYKNSLNPTPENQQAVQEAQQNVNNAARENLRTVQADPLSAQSTRNSGSCSLIHFNFGNCFLEGFSWVGTIITYVFGSVLWLAGYLFDLSVYISITSFHSWITIPGVEKAWTVLRDFANLCFIFILLYIAFGTIIDYKGIANKAQGMIVNVIIIALLVNFSGFFTRVVIDASNVIAYEFYTKTGGYDPGKNGVGLNNIGSTLVGKLGLQEYITKPDSNSAPAPTIQHLSFLGIITQTFGNIVVILMTSFILLTASILFMIRTITLIFVYVLSPVAFVSYIIPGKFNYFQPWLDKLIKQSFFAPGFLVPLYLVYQLFDKGSIAALVPSQTGNVAGGTLSLIVFDVVVLGMLTGCIFIGNAIGAMGMAVAQKYAGLGTKGLTKAVGRAPSLVNRGLGQTGAALTRAGSSIYARGAGNASLTGRALRRVGMGVAVTGGRAGQVSRAVTKGSAAVSGVAKALGESAVVKTIEKTSIGKSLTGAIKNPLLTTSDLIGTAASFGGVAGVNILGNTREERAAAAKSAKEQADKDRISEYEAALNSATPTTAQAIVTGIPKEYIIKIKPETLVLPNVSVFLTHGQLGAIDRANMLSPAQELTIKTAILRHPQPTPPLSGYVYMTGPNAANWG